MKILFALILLLAPLPAVARTPAVVTRVDYVFEIARVSCYRLQTTPAGQVGPVLVTIRDRAHLTDEEVNLLINYCMVYDQGYQRKRSPDRSK